MKDTSIVTMSTAVGKVGERQMPRVEVLDDDHAFVIPQLPVQLTVADVERHDAHGAALQQHVGEAARRCADVQALASADLDVKRIERMRELEAAATGIRVIRRQERDGRLIVDRSAGLGGGSIVDGDLSGQDQCARTFARRSESAFDDELIQTDARHHRLRTAGSTPRTLERLESGSWRLQFQFDRLTIHLPIAIRRSSSMPADRRDASARSRHSAAMRRDVSRP